jgi:hypothetical protein
MNDQTNQKDPANRYDEGLSKLEKQLRSIWQGWQFRKQTFEDDVEVNVEEIRQLLDMGDDCDEATKC